MAIGLEAGPPEVFVSVFSTKARLFLLLTRILQLRAALARECGALGPRLSAHPLFARTGLACPSGNRPHPATNAPGTLSPANPHHCFPWPLHGQQTQKPARDKLRGLRRI